VASRPPKVWPRSRPQTFGHGMASISLSYCVIGHFTGKNRVNSGILLIFPAIILNRMLLILVLFHNYFWPRSWPQPPEIDLDLGLIALASASTAS